VGRPLPLSEEALNEAVKQLGEPWAVERNQLRATFQTKSYAAGLALIARAGAIAEELDHHPTLTLDYGRVAVAITTHDAGGLTNLDVAYATAFSELYASSKFR